HGLETIFICFGGADNRNLTRHCAQTVVESNIFGRITIVIGSAYQEKDELFKFAENQPNIRLYDSIGEGKMLELMNDSDVAVAPASGVLLEVLSTGCTVISGKYVDNQKYLHGQYREINAFIDAGDFSKEKLKRALEI